MAVPPAPVRVPSQRPLAPSVTPVTSVAHDKGDNEVIPWAVQSLAFALQLRETYGLDIVFFYIKMCSVLSNLRHFSY